MDNIIAAKSLQVERKSFQVEFRENDRGQFLRINEESHGRRNTIIVPRAPRWAESPPERSARVVDGRRRASVRPTAVAIFGDLAEMPAVEVLSAVRGLTGTLLVRGS